MRIASITRARVSALTRILDWLDLFRTDDTTAEDTPAICATSAWVGLRVRILVVGLDMLKSIKLALIKRIIMSDRGAVNSRWLRNLFCLLMAHEVFSVFGCFGGIGCNDGYV
ncbi:MAG: hypothetical protein RL120_10035 [Gammaproteobacteria bacterium]